MKLTWFGGTTIRVHVGGAIVVIDAAQAPGSIDAAELVSGADRVIEGFGAGLPTVDMAKWRPRKPVRLVDEGAEPAAVEVWSAGEGAVLVEALGEPPLLLLTEVVPSLGRWVEDAVVALFGDGERLVALGTRVLEDQSPRLLAIAGREPAIDDAVERLRDRLDRTGLVALEAGQALEI